MVFIQRFLSQCRFVLSAWMYWLPGCILIILVPNLLKYRRYRALPPGPRGLPILGNILQVPGQMPWFKFAEWAEEFGPIFSLNMAGQPVIVLSTFKTGADLLDRRSDNYSDRPPWIMAGEILTGGIHKVLARYGDTWRKMRRISHEGFSSRASQKYQPVQAREAAFAVMQILKTPDAWVDHLRRAPAGGILSAVYGWPPIGEKDESVINRMHAHVARISASLVPGAYFVDMIPALKYAPRWMAKWKREGLEWHQQETKMFVDLTKEVEEKMRLGNSPHCFVSELIENRDRHDLTEKEAAWLAGTLLAGGGDTTFGSLLYCIQAMVLYPEVMHKAQAELDNIVGRDRIPTFEDQKDLPYICALVQEVLRWRPPTPLGVPRAVTEDDWYQGYLIPKGATIMTNTWAMNRDPKIFPDFDDFRPDRFLDKIPEDTHSMGHTTFGFGRRICVGYNFANQMLFITIASMLWALDIDKAKDPGGNPIVPSKHDFLDLGLVIAPAPFKCKILPRFPDVLSILQRELPEEVRFDI